MKKTLLAAVTAAGLTASAGQAGAMAGDDHDHAMLFGAVQVEELEWRFRDGADLLFWDATAWYGGDYDRVVLRTEGEKPSGEGVEHAEVRLLWSHMLDDFWNVEGGIRHDIRPQPQTTYAAIGLVGLAPYFIETEAFAYLSEDGDLTAEVKGEFELLFTQRLHLVTDAKVGFSARKVEALEQGAGVTELELGSRLKYEVVRKFAPYVGLVWERKLGATADFARAEGKDADSLSLVSGVSVWF